MRRLLIPSFATVVIGGCLAPNPNASDDESESSTAGTDGSTDATETESGSTDETGEDDPSCSDGMKNGTETDEDCGGECGPCEDGKDCAGPDDCASMICDGVCIAPSCSDGVQNGSESLEDCGGSCPVCVLTELHAEWAHPDADGETQPAVAMHEDGSFAIAWVTPGLDIMYRWFDADGENPSDGFVVDNTVPEERRPQLRIHDDGMTRELVVGYHDTYIQNGGPDVVMWGFDPSGGWVRGPIKIDVYNQVTVDGFAFDLQGDELAFAWYGLGTLYARRYDLGDESFVEMQDVQVSDAPIDEGLSVAYADDGGYLVTWTEDQGDFHFDVYARRRTPAGAWVGEKMPINDLEIMGIQRTPSVARLPSGEFIVVWTGATDADPGGGIAGRLLDDAGVPIGGEIQINEILEDTQEFPTVVATGNGFAVAWQDLATQTIRLRRFAGDGTPWHDDEAPWGSTADLQPTPPAMAANDEQLVMLWSAGDPDREVQGVRLAP